MKYLILIILLVSCKDPVIHEKIDPNAMEIIKINHDKLDQNAMGIIKINLPEIDINDLERIIVIFPDIGRKHPQLSSDVYYISEGKHYIFYRQCDEEIEILRFLHHQVDIIKHISEDL